MSRLSGPKRKKMYEFLARRDGERCFIGGERGNYHTLIIDHADNDNSNNTPSNLHLVCRQCNSMKNPRGRASKSGILSSVYVCEESNPYAFEYPKASSAEFVKNQQSEPAVRHWTFIEIWRKGRLPLDEAIDCAAAIGECSQESVRRYYRKETSRVRIYEFVEDQATGQKYIQFKPEWERFRQKEEQRRKADWQARNWRKDQIKNVAFIEKDNKKKLDEMRRNTVEAGPAVQIHLDVAGPSSVIAGGCQMTPKTS
jgi:hypothetical protein